MEHGEVSSVDVRGIAQDIFLHCLQERRRVLREINPLSLSTIFLVLFEESGSIFVDVK
jgi:hypothetical protein